MVQHPRRRGLVVNDLAEAGPCYGPVAGQILDEWILEERAGAIFWLLRDVRRSKAWGGEHGAGVTQTFGLRFAGSSINERWVDVQPYSIGETDIFRLTGS